MKRFLSKISIIIIVVCGLFTYSIGVTIASGNLPAYTGVSFSGENSISKAKILGEIDTKFYEDYSLIFNIPKYKILNPSDDIEEGTVNIKIYNASGILIKDILFSNEKKIFSREAKLSQEELKNAPFYAQIYDKGYDILSNKVQITGQFTEKSVSGNTGNSGNSGTLKNSSNSNTKVSVDEKTSGGIKVLFGISKLETNNNILSIGAAVAYDNLLEKRPSIGRYSIDIYGKNGSKIGTEKFENLDFIPLSRESELKNREWTQMVTSVEINPEKGPFSFVINELDLKVSSRKLTVDDLKKTEQNLENGNGGENGGDTLPKSQSRGTFKNPLRPELQTIPGIVNLLVKEFVVPIAVPLLGIAIMWTGFLFVRARGNPGELGKAKEALKYTLMGGALILGAYVIAEALQGTITSIVR